MRIVSAGMHTSGLLRCKRQSCLLRHRQRVHIAAQQNGRPGASPFERGHDATGFLRQFDFKIQARKGIEHRLLRAREMQAELRMLMDLATKSHGAGVECFCFFKET